MSKLMELARVVSSKASPFIQGVSSARGVTALPKTQTPHDSFKRADSAFTFPSGSADFSTSADSNSTSILNWIKSILKTKEQKESLTNLSDPSDAFKQAVIKLLRQNVLGIEDFELIEAHLITSTDKTPESSKKKIVAAESTKLFAGRVVDVKDGKILPHESGQPPIIFVSGLGQSCSERRVLSRHAEAQELFVGRKVSIYVPASEVLVDKENTMNQGRYANGMAPYFNPNYIDEKGSSDFFEQVIKPKFCNAEGKLLPPEQCQRLLLVNHSIAAREAGSHVRWFMRYLEENGVAAEDVEKYTKKILRFNIASPVVEGNEGGPVFHVVNMNDSGSKKPQSYLCDIYCNPEFQQSRISTVRLRDESILTVLGFGVVRDGETTKDGFCHSVVSHIAAIKKEGEFAPMLAACEIFSNPAISDAEAFAAVDKVIKSAKPFVKPQISKEDFGSAVKTLHEAWSDNYLERLLSKQSLGLNTGIPSPNPGGPICNPVRGSSTYNSIVTKL